MLTGLLAALRRICSLPDMPANADSAAWAWADYRRAQDVAEAPPPAPNFGEAAVLDIGCGLGGRTIRYAERGARQVVGIDVSPVRARVARDLADRHPAGARAAIVIADAGRLPFCAAAFDAVLSTDAWEHIAAPDQALRECARVVRPGGIVTIRALPYYSPWGAHAWRWLPLPWVQVILPPPALFRLIAWIEHRRQINPRLPAAVRIDWARPDDAAHARKLTVAAFERSLAASGLSLLRFTIAPVGARHGRFAARLGARLVRVPGLRELLAGEMTACLQRAPAEEGR